MFWARWDLGSASFHLCNEGGFLRPKEGLTSLGEGGFLRLSQGSASLGGGDF